MVIEHLLLHCQEHDKDIEVELGLAEDRDRGPFIAYVEVQRGPSCGCPVPSEDQIKRGIYRGDIENGSGI